MKQGTLSVFSSLKKEVVLERNYVKSFDGLREAWLVCFWRHYEAAIKLSFSCALQGASQPISGK